MEYKRYVHRNNLYLDVPLSDEKEVFMLVFDVSCVNEEELYIERVEENRLKLSLKHELRNCGNISFSRNCTYVYTLPENVLVSNLVAYWSGDDFLVIKEKQTKSTENTSSSREDPCEQQESDEILESPVAKNENATKQEILSTTEESTMQDSENEKLVQKLESSSESEGKIILEKKSVSATNNIKEKIMLKKEFVGATSENEEKVKISIIVLGERGETVMQVDKDTRISFECEEALIEEKKYINESSESKEEKSTSASGESKEKKLASRESNEKSEAKSMEASNSMQTKSLLIPYKIPELFNQMLSKNDLIDVVNDINKRINFVNEFLEKYKLGNPIETFV